MKRFFWHALFTVLLVTLVFVLWPKTAEGDPAYAERRLHRPRVIFATTTTTTTTTTVKHSSPTQPPPSQPPPALPAGSAKMFIYNHESGNNPAARNGAGCRGLGQACPGSKLPCSDSDYACQDSWFTSYMVGRYSTWENARAIWISRATRCGNDWCDGWW